MNEVIIHALGRRIQAKELTIEQVPNFYRHAVEKFLEGVVNNGV